MAKPFSLSFGKKILRSGYSLLNGGSAKIKSYFSVDCEFCAAKRKTSFLRHITFSVIFHFSAVSFIACKRLLEISTIVAELAPLDMASKPTAPVPAYKSKTLKPCIQPIMLKRASLVFEDVGRTFLSFKGNKARPRKSPAVIRILAENEGLEPPSLTAAVFKTADLPLA